MNKITIDRERFIVRVGGKDVYLSPKEFDLLALLHDMDGRVVSREFAVKKVWGGLHGYDTRTVDQHIARMRRKLGDEAIRTVPTRGYAIGVGE